MKFLLIPLVLILLISFKYLLNKRNRIKLFKKIEQGICVYCSQVRGVFEDKKEFRFKVCMECWDGYTGEGTHLKKSSGICACGALHCNPLPLNVKNSLISSKIECRDHIKK